MNCENKCKKPCKKQFQVKAMTIPDYKFALSESVNGDKRFLPTRAHNTDTGWDVRSAVPGTLIIKPNEKFLIPLGFRAFCPPGFWFEVKPRSSTFVKKHIHCLYGTVDEGYAGEIMFAGQYILPSFISGSVIRDSNLKIDFGDALGQIIPIKRQEMNVIEVSNEEIEAMYKQRNADRGVGGFGSSG